MFQSILALRKQLASQTLYVIELFTYVINLCTYFTDVDVKAEK